MNSLLTPQQRTAAFRQMLYTDFPTTHVGTLNVLPQHRNEHDMRQIFQYFQKKFDTAVWGGNGYKSGKRMGAVAFLHARTHIDDAHIHMGFWSLPERLTAQQLGQKFQNTAQHTHGVLYTQTRAPYRGAIAVHFESQRTGGWLNYCSRLLADSSDTHCLIDLIQLPAKTPEI
jgi:hypothetical protein